MKLYKYPFDYNLFLFRNGATDALDRVHRPETDVVNAENRIMDAFVSIKMTVRRIKTAIITASAFLFNRVLCDVNKILPYICISI